MGPLNASFVTADNGAKEWIEHMLFTFISPIQKLPREFRTCGPLRLNHPSRDTISDEAEMQLWAFYDPITLHLHTPYSILLFRLILPSHDTPDPGAMWFDQAFLGYLQNITIQIQMT